MYEIIFAKCCSFNILLIDFRLALNVFAAINVCNYFAFAEIARVHGLQACPDLQFYIKSFYQLNYVLLLIKLRRIVN